MPDFRPLPNKPAPSPGLVLRLHEQTARYLRLTHVFKDGVYAMSVGEAEDARYARRPKFYSLKNLEALSSATSPTWGRIVLPGELSTSPEPGSDRDQKLQSARRLIDPLIDAFKRKTNLLPAHFTAFIREHASRSGVAERTLLRLVLRYYYFGGSYLALSPLPRGPKRSEKSSVDVGESAGADGYGDGPEEPKRRGPKNILSDEIGPNDFIVSQDDIDDMVQSYKRLLKTGPTNKTAAHENYLSTAFKLRHPELHQRYIDKKAPEPVTYRQFYYYLEGNLRLEEDLEKNERRLRRNPSNLNSLVAAGPGEIYEIDSTGGRFYLVSSDDAPVLVGKPTIYLLIDRWSRFVVSAYLSLRSPSYEEVRNTLLIAFTPRSVRFSRLGVDVSDELWPVGCIPAVICPDRGSDFTSDSMRQSVVNDLRIELNILPPLCPDGKAIVERFIRTVKQRMAESGKKGVYANRPLDPDSKRAARKAQAAAVHTLADAYRLLVEIIVDHNNRPHSALRRRKVLTLHGVEPTPKNAYLWGLKHITGLHSAPYSEEDYHRLLLSSDKASISNGVLRYRTRAYHPANEAAIDFISRSSKKLTSLGVRLDKTLPTEIFLPSRHGDWPKFVMGTGDARDIEGISLDEEDAFATCNARLWARSSHESRRKRVADKSAKTRKAKVGTPPAAIVSNAEQQAARYRETAQFKEQLHGRPIDEVGEAEDQSAASTKTWMQVEQDERARLVEIAAQKRKRKNK